MPGNIFEAYLAGQASSFFSGHFMRAADRKQAVGRALRPLAPRVLAALEAQNAAFGRSEARSTQLAALGLGAAAVVTGQQVGLFLGPLYTVYKAATAIRVARALAAETGKPVVPIFWLQTEDHDLVEIAHCSVPRAQQPALTLTLPAAADNRTSIAYLSLPSEIAACLASLESELGELPYAREHLARLARHYRPGVAWGRAFAGVLAELFEPQGLLLIDPRDPALALEVASVHRQALAQSDALGRSLVERCDALEQGGFAATVHVRADAPLSFVHADGRQSPRYRLQLCGTEFGEIGGARTHTRDALYAALERDPLCFSSSALLRPIVQDTLLPTAAYVGGPAEVGYFAQLAPLYAAFGLPMPIVVPRARFRVIEPSTTRLLTRLGVSAEAAAQTEDALLRQLDAVSGNAQQTTPATFQRALVDGFEHTLSDALAMIAPLDQQLTASIGTTRDKVRISAAKLSEKYANLLARSDEVRLSRVRRLQWFLHPHGEPQERVLGLSYFAARYGERDFIDRVLLEITPFDATQKEIVL